ncbi:MAG TPA: c-type cytochrome [Burkholderiales bacterium]|nr:c-type cytochrome [Burkholderiales bacterium]
MAPAFRGLVLLLALAACERPLPEHEPATGGNPRSGKQLIQHFGCGSCHTIPGVPGASATVAPSLEKLKSRQYLAGRLSNTPQDLQKWIRKPQSVDPKTAMPDVGLDEQQARDIAAYLYSR